MPSPYPKRNFFFLAGNIPSELSQKRATLSLASVQWSQITFSKSTPIHTNYTQQRKIKSRHPDVPAALELLKDLDKSNTTAALWAELK